MKKNLCLLVLVVLPLIVSHSAKFPDGGYTGPYVYYTDAEFGYIEADAVYEEDVVTFAKSGPSLSIASAPCVIDGVTIPACCQFCAEGADDFDAYFDCVEKVFDDGGLACTHKRDGTSPISACPVHGAAYALGQIAVTCVVPIGGGAALLLVFTLPYAFVRWRKRNNSYIFKSQKKSLNHK